ncbi:MAG: Undecaprenyl-diphosphatase [Candidatus Collierbacteria bacterium GW2011_GWF2_44_15]|uniref:Undecaprenyl-diphosphatase n=1 Tax=Candidatus Collierbacteria bacterium GW2011_GWF2_44_15 TaxID=1618404 RepID=A0A0G1HI34_9BACT|nr:MAG: Undecaprenyl-diphosphatase [Candidatus Collierbacteria bacterium GW2011_GWF2_44_15]
MTLIQAILLGIIEGVTEFLPISSTGHLILAERLFNIPSTDFSKTFSIFIQLGAILAVIWLYFPKIIQSKKLWLPITLAFIPTGILGAIAYPYIKSFLLDNVLVTSLSLLIGGVLLFILDKTFKQKAATHSVEKLSPLRLVLIGIFQSFSFVPGVSRSAASIIGGLSVGLDRVEAVEFSFLLAIPTMASAVAYDLYKSGLVFTQSDLLLLAVGFIVSFLTALLAIKAFIKYVVDRGFVSFAIYRIILAIIVLLLLKN